MRFENTNTVGPLGFLTHLKLEERQAISEFVAEVETLLESNFRSAWLFGSAARGDRWKANQSMRSDVDIMLVSEIAATETQVDAVVDSTYSYFLMCGAQISPQFRAVEWVNQPPDQKAEDFLSRLHSDAVAIFPDKLIGQRFNCNIA